MGGYGAYVWSAYGVAAVVLTTNALLPVFRFRALRREIERGGGRR
ncbi:MAG: heme exporter protein CcmD [Nitrococcus sp.]|nr:heme exporter protein CcmD [Nitrococcus sp.]